MPLQAFRRVGGQTGEFEKCPRWVPGVDGCWPSTPIILKTLGVDRFDLSPSWPPKVRNVSRLGSHSGFRTSTFRLINIETMAYPARVPAGDGAVRLIVSGLPARIVRLPLIHHFIRRRLRAIG